jgi:hypothetical protein
MIGPSGQTNESIVTTNPILLAEIPNGTAINAGTGIFKGYTVPSNGIVSIYGAITGAASVLTFTWDGMNYYTLFGGSNMAANAIYCATIGVAAGDNINVSASVSTTSGVIRIFFTPSS